MLVARVEGFASEAAWSRAYAEINEFERQLVDFGMIVRKFWLHNSAAVALRRFEERRTVAYQSWKLTDEDRPNREKWLLYEEAADAMLLRTSTPAAPWTIVEAEDKRYAHIKVLRTVVRRMEEELGKVTL